MVRKVGDVSEKVSQNPCAAIDHVFFLQCFLLYGSVSVKGME